MSDLVEIKPTIRADVECLFCHSIKVVLKKLIFQGIHVLADCMCLVCNKQFYHTLPIGHDKLFPLSFDKTKIRSAAIEETREWLIKPLIDSFFRYPEQEATIKKKLFFKKEEAIILNCLDTCFGHVFTKLWNVLGLLNAFPDKSIIVLLPKKMEWLVPEGVAEVWTVDLPLGKLGMRVAGLDSFVKQELPRFKKAFLSPAHIHLDTEKLNMKSLLKRKGFNLSRFSTAPLQISFVLRDDRFWHSSAFEYFMYKVCLKFQLLAYFRGYFVREQNGFINKIARKVTDELKDVRLCAMGIGKKGSLSPLINDLRTHDLTPAVEELWCENYAKSHIVIGVHGSNMLIPTSLAAGFIEILPRHKIPHITEDLVLQHSSRYAVFLGRHVDHYAPADLVSMHATSMIRKFPFLHKNTEQNYTQE